VRLAHVVAGVNGAGQTGDCAARSGPCREAYRIEQILGAVGGERTGRPHGCRQHHRFGGREHAVKEVSRFFQRVGAVRDDDARHVVAREVIRHAKGKIAPDHEAHILAVDLGHLFGVQVEGLQRRNCRQQIGHCNLPRDVSQIVAAGARPSGDGATGAENDDALHRMDVALVF